MNSKFLDEQEALAGEVGIPFNRAEFQREQIIDELHDLGLTAFDLRNELDGYFEEINGKLKKQNEHLTEIRYLFFIGLFLLAAVAVRLFFY